MFKFILRRVLWSIPVLLLVIFFTFLLMKAIPGGPFTGEKSIPAEILANMNAKYGLDKPWYIQYLRYVWLASAWRSGRVHDTEEPDGDGRDRGGVPRVHATWRSWPSLLPSSSAIPPASSRR